MDVRLRLLSRLVLLAAALALCGWTIGSLQWVLNEPTDVAPLASSEFRVPTQSGNAPRNNSKSNSTHTTPPTSNNHSNNERSTIIVDILSIGSQTRPQLQQIQVGTFGRHAIVRTFFLADERVDGDPQCGTVLTRHDAYQISQYCRRNPTWRRDDQWVMYLLRRHYSSPAMLQANARPAKWLCAQARPLYALAQVQKYYNNQHSNDEDEDRLSSLPDYFILLDDDTYYNLEAFQRHFSSVPNSAAMAVAGCQVKFSQRFSAPLGGFGLILSRAVLERLIVPLNCSTTTATTVHRSRTTTSTNTNSEDGKDGDNDGNAQLQLHLCQKLKLNRIGEYPVVQQQQRKMSVVEVMKEYANQSPFRDYRNWTTGYCLHSDWATGYLVWLLGGPEPTTTSTRRGSSGGGRRRGNNIVRLQSYDTHPQMKSVFNKRFKYDKVPLNICRYEGENCTATSEACHYAKQNVMTKIFQQHKRQTPAKFGELPRVVRLF